MSFLFGMITGRNAPPEKVFMCDNEADLPSQDLEEGYIAILKSEMGSFEVNSNLKWIRKTRIETWPIGSVIILTNEKNPGDLLGYGKWEQIKKESKMFYWERLS